MGLGSFVAEVTFAGVTNSVSTHIITFVGRTVVDLYTDPLNSDPGKAHVGVWRTVNLKYVRRIRIVYLA